MSESRVKGIGGVFIRSNNPKQLVDWYTKHLGIQFEEYAEFKAYGMDFVYCEDEDNLYRRVVFSINKAGEELNGQQQVELNFMVEDIEKVKAELEAEGIKVEDIDDYDYGRFTWIHDIEGNKIELYQPLPFDWDKLDEDGK